jgi:hypothetical protein
VHQKKNYLIYLYLYEVAEKIKSAVFYAIFFTLMHMGSFQLPVAHHCGTKSDNCVSGWPYSTPFGPSLIPPAESTPSSVATPSSHPS